MNVLNYEVYDSASEVPFAQWKEKGIKIPIFDRDGTCTHANSPLLIDEVIDGLRLSLPGVYDTIAIVSNNSNAENVRFSKELLADALGIDVFAVSRADGYPRKPNPAMGFIVAAEFGVRPDQLGVVGDRRLTDIAFGRRLGAGAMALCKKAGDGDAMGVPAIRMVESALVAFDRRLGRVA